MKKILYGICGIGLGHIYRQLPILEALKGQAKIAIFAYGESLTFCEEHFAEDAHIQVIPVAVPFVVGDATGLNFAKSLSHEANQQNFWEINTAAMAQAQAFIGQPDAVLTDYEPVSAQYAYMHDVPLYTLDQQSKYLVGDYPEEVGNISLADEVQRLRMFFPKAHKRVVFSFFDVNVKPQYAGEVQMVSPVLRQELQDLKREVKSGSFLIYLSAQGGHSQSLSEIQEVCAAFPECEFYIFDGKSASDEAFIEALRTCEGMMSTAGHSLMSEAVALGIPVYTMPLPIYEQQMNAMQIEEMGQGMVSPKLTQNGFKAFQTFCESFEPVKQPQEFRVEAFIENLL